MRKARERRWRTAGLCCGGRKVNFRLHNVRRGGGLTFYSLAPFGRYYQHGQGEGAKQKGERKPSLCGMFLHNHNAETLSPLPGRRQPPLDSDSLADINRLLILASRYLNGLCIGRNFGKLQIDKIITG